MKPFTEDVNKIIKVFSKDPKPNLVKLCVWMKEVYAPLGRVHVWQKFFTSMCYIMMLLQIYCGFHPATLTVVKSAMKIHHMLIFPLRESQQHEDRICKISSTLSATSIHCRFYLWNSVDFLQHMKPRSYRIKIQIFLL